MPQKQNPVDAVLIRSAALRAPGLAAQLQLAAGLAVDERPDGAWHAEWPVLVELLQLTAGAGIAAALTGGLRFDVDKPARICGSAGGSSSRSDWESCSSPGSARTVRTS